MPDMKRSDLPFGSEFFPSIIELPEALVIAKANDGDTQAFESVAKDAFFGVAP
jgi:hypothetical protein